VRKYSAGSMPTDCNWLLQVNQSSYLSARDVAGLFSIPVGTLHSRCNVGTFPIADEKVRVSGGHLRSMWLVSTVVNELRRLYLSGEYK
jgi:hypothetical protein